jgi:hypothetical protein
MTSTEVPQAAAAAMPAETGDALAASEAEAASNFVSPPTPSSEASKSTCSAPMIEVEMDEDSPAASPISSVAMKNEPGAYPNIG